MIQKVLDLKKKLEDLNSSIENRQSALEVAQATDREIADIDAAIAQIEADKKKVAEQALKAQEDELKAIQKAQEEAKKRAEEMTSLNQAINDQIESYERGEELEATRKMLKSSDFAAVESKRKEQEQLASYHKEAYRGLLEQAANASTPEGKEFFLE